MFGVARTRTLVLLCFGVTAGLVSTYALLAVASEPATLQPVPEAAVAAPAEALGAAPSAEGEENPPQVCQPAAGAVDTGSDVAPGFPEVMEGAGKGPGLASPAPSPLQTAASAVAARNAGRTLKVGIQVGHWRTNEYPEELAFLRKSTGAEGSGWREVDVNLEVSQRIASMLAPFGIQVDLLPGAVPVSYKADAFVSIHGDANGNRSLSGFKIARATKSAIPQKDDALVNAIRQSYEKSTGLNWHAKTITQNMLQYYAFDRRFQHSVDAGTPAVIVELGFLTNSGDLDLMKNQPNQLAEAIATGILNFLAR